LVAVVGLDACATTETATTASTESTEVRPRRRRRRRRPATDATATAQSGTPGTDGATASSGSTLPPSAASFGAPVVSGEQRREVTPRWVVESGGRARVLCEGAAQRPTVVSPQCPLEPENAAIVRAFLPVERRVLACNPPANAEGRLPVRATFTGAGVPYEVSFPRMEVAEDAALCMGRALCEMRMPTFRMSESTVNYEYVVLLPDDGN
jgi:hypothetical protein